jgi:FkbM family methyltransferase
MVFDCNGVRRIEIRGLNLIAYDDSVKFLSNADFYQLGSLDIIYRELWKNGEYDVFPVKDEQVVDVGGFLGDSAIYFLQKGAKFVNVYEPGETFDLIQANLRLNGFYANQYNLHNAAVTGKSGSLNYNSNWNCGQICFEKHNAMDGANEMKTFSLADIAVDDAILKFDTEGSEYSTFGNADRDTIRKFKAIMMEYHDNGYLPITKKLEECGFKIVQLNINNGYEKATEGTCSSGMIYAQRLDSP